MKHVCSWSASVAGDTVSLELYLHRDTICLRLDICGADEGWRKHSAAAFQVLDTPGVWAWIGQVLGQVLEAQGGVLSYRGVHDPDVGEVDQTNSLWLWPVQVIQAIGELQGPEAQEPDQGLRKAYYQLLHLADRLVPLLMNVRSLADRFPLLKGAIEQHVPGGPEALDAFIQQITAIED
jgi:hypothetical protein